MELSHHPSSCPPPGIQRHKQEFSEVIQAVATRKELVAAQGLDQGEIPGYCEDSATAEATTNTLPTSCR